MEYKLEITLTQRGCIEVKGDEFLVRNAIAGYIDSYRLIADVESMVFRRRNILFESILKNLTGIYPEDTVQKIKIIIESSEQKFSFFLTDDYFTSLLTHIVIGVSRLLSGNTVSEEFYPPDDEEYPEFVVETAEYIAQCLESVFNISVSNIERTYISIHLVGFNAISTDNSTSVKIRKKIKTLGIMMISSIDSRLGTAFINDESLFFDLSLHLKATVFRLQKDIYHKKTAQFQLTDSDAYLYDAVVKASSFYWEICGVVPDEEELLSITCYLLLSIRRNMRKPKALLICNDGITKRMELMDFIGTTIPSIEVADCCTVYQYKNTKINDFNFIISTENIQSPGMPMVELSAVDRSDYTNLITNFLAKSSMS
jgi:transcriptional antiterminator